MWTWIKVKQAEFIWVSRFSYQTSPAYWSHIALREAALMFLCTPLCGLCFCPLDPQLTRQAHELGCFFFTCFQNRARLFQLHTDSIKQWSSLTLPPQQHSRAIHIPKELDFALRDLPAKALLCLDLHSRGELLVGVYSPDSDSYRGSYFQ